ncbi:Uncharacterized protein TCM_029094 [Theobroma cacao]|uniref:Uncharacterized protein n=1 Tax=Theobroma cacao TaxID=3641 RepID=A0A061GDI6_THECC|nr:Uncharacterized protein TCM_029094 [Theobroma cacao]
MGTLKLLTSTIVIYPGLLESSCEGMSVFREARVKVLYVANPIVMDDVEVPVLGFGGYGRNCTARLPNKGGFKLVCGHPEEYGWTSWYILTSGIDEYVSKFSSFLTEKYWVPWFVKIGNYLSCVQRLFTGCNVYVSKDVNMGGWEIYHKIVADSIKHCNMKTQRIRSLDGLVDARKDFVRLHVYSLVSWSSF